VGGSSRKEERKVFFSEEKKQKTFDFQAMAGGVPWPSYVGSSGIQEG
jgi:hypothetical protein